MNYQQEIHNLILRTRAHPALGIKHCYRVYYQAKELAQPLSLDDEILYAAAMLHDIGKYPEYALPNVDHALRSKGVACNVLQKLEFPQHKLPKVLDAIEHHMYYSEPGRSDEAVYLRDANILDNLGNIGLLRFFSLIGQDELLPNAEETLERARIFAEALPNKVFTKNGRRIAVKRREEMLRFLAGLKKQTAEYAWI